MIKAILSDLSRVVLLPKDKKYHGKLNDLYKEHAREDNFIFFKYFETNERLLNLFSELKSKLPIYLFTTEYIQNDPAIKPKLESVFNRIFSADELGLFKKDPKSYLLIASEMNIDPTLILYIDDLSENIATAKEAGFNSSTLNKRLKTFPN